MASGEFTYITPWSVDYHPHYGLVFRDRSDTRNQKPGGTLAAKMYRVGEVFALDLTALSVDDLSHLANPRHLSDEDINMSCGLRQIVFSYRISILRLIMIANKFQIGRSSTQFISKYSERHIPSPTLNMDRTTTYDSNDF